MYPGLTSFPTNFHTGLHYPTGVQNNLSGFEIGGGGGYQGYQRSSSANFQNVYFLAAMHRKRVLNSLEAKIRPRSPKVIKRKFSKTLNLSSMHRRSILDNTGC